MVAEKRSVCRWCLKKSMMLRTSSSNPKSIIRSASSSAKYRHKSSVIRFFVSRSCSLPGVAQMVCTPIRIISSCSFGGIPPMQSMLRKPPTSPPAISASQRPCATSCVCRANSREGQTTMPIGPSPRTSGIRLSSSAANITSGSVKASVFPEPVNAIPIRSRPASTAGRPWIWIGVGFRMPRALRCSRIAGGIRMSLKDLFGCGMSSPSTRMFHLLRISCASSSLMSRMCEGGVQPVVTDSKYTTPFASSATDMSGRIELSIDSRILRSSSSRSWASESLGSVLLAIISARWSSKLCARRGSSARTADEAPPPLGALPASTGAGSTPFSRPCSVRLAAFSAFARRCLTGT
mmetsp:Transcript_24875/g.63018  ORF Transcript_24875/g.63018 Transcript_24875/m.63018 type:complete len:350 (-) Transcript_24875:120-1169(-)